MKSLLFALLAASLAANVLLLVRTRPSSTPAATRDGVAPGGQSSSSVPGETVTPAGGKSATPTASGDATAPLAWNPLSSEPELHQLVARLRAAGYPPAVIRALMNHLLNERFAARQPANRLPYWKQPGGPEAAANLNALNRERRQLFESLLGADARPSAMLKPGERDRRYGNLSDEKIDAIAGIDLDYAEMTAEAWARRRGTAAFNVESSVQTQQLMEQEKLADYAAVLSPEELAQYQLRNSPTANALMNNLRGVDVSEAEYARLFEARKRFDEANPMRSIMEGPVLAQRQAAQLALNEQAREVLGEERFYAYLAEADRQYGQVAHTLATKGVTAPATSYQVYQLQTELQGHFAQLNRGGALSKEKGDELRAVADAYNARLETLLGPDVANAYRTQGPGRIFSAFRPTLPAAATAPSKG